MSSKLKLDDVRKRIAKESGESQATVKAVLDATENVVSEALDDDAQVPLGGLGTFVRADRAARQGRNPQTGESIKIPAKKGARLKVGKAITDYLNED